MNIRLVTWLRLNRAMVAVRSALADVDCEASLALLGRDNDEADVAFLRGLLADLETVSVLLARHDTAPQSEWPGGPSIGPNALPTLMRYPAHPGLLSNRRYFTKEEVDEAKAAGLLRGDYGGG